MELSWSSFILELINFLILIWILKHFFYAPIQKAILQRKQTVQGNIDQAQKMHDEAQQLQVKYENRLKDWEVEKATKQKELQQEMDEFKSRELTNIEKTVEKEREKINSREMQRISSIIENNANQSMLIASKFAAQFLKDFSDADIESKIVNKVIDDLSHLDDIKLNLLKNNQHDETGILIQSAYSLNEAQKLKLSTGIKKILGDNIKITFVQESRLLAGLNIVAGSVSLQANLRDELKYFAEAGKEHV